MRAGLEFVVRSRGAYGFLVLSWLLFWSEHCSKEIDLTVKLLMLPLTPLAHTPFEGGEGVRTGYLSWQGGKERNAVLCGNSRY